MAACAVAVLIGAATAACGGGGSDEQSYERLPSASRGAPTSSGQPLAADSGEHAALLAPARPLEYKLRPGLPDLPDAAPAYRYSEGLDRDRMSKLAAAFGMHREFEEGEAGIRRLREGRAELVVEDLQPVAWSYLRDAAAAETPVSSDTPAAPIPGLPSTADAERAARRLLAASGFDPGTARLTVEGDGVMSRAVDATPVLGGFAAPALSMSIGFGAGGAIEYAEGVLGRAEKLGDYAVVDLPDAFERVDEEAQVNPTGAVPPAPDDRAIAEPAPPATTADGGPTMTIEPPGATPRVPLQPEVIELTAASVVLEAVAGGCDELLLVPSVSFQAGEDPGPTVDAVVDAQRQAAAPADAGVAEDCPDAGGGGGVEPGKPEPAPAPDAGPGG